MRFDNTSLDTATFSGIYGSTFTDTAAPPDHAFAYSLTETTSSGTSSPSTLSAATPPPMPTNLNFSFDGTTGTVSWQLSLGDFYTLDRQNSDVSMTRVGQTYGVQTAATGRANLPDGPLAADSALTYFLTATNNGLTSPAAVLTENIAPAPLSNFTAAPIAGGGVQLSWSASYPTGTVFHITASDPVRGTTDLGTTTDVAMTDAGAPASTHIVYTGTATTPNGTSDPATTSIDTPAQLDDDGDYDNGDTSTNDNDDDDTAPPPPPPPDVTADSITGSIGPQSETSTDNTLGITDDNVFAVPRSDGTISLTLNGLSSDDPAVLQNVHWTLQRNSADVVGGEDPTLSPDSDHPREVKASLTTDGVGSFNVIAYFDKNGNGQYDAGEELRVFHVAEVSVTVQDGMITPNNANYAADLSGATAVFSSGSLDHPAIAFNYTVVLRGGGADETIGDSHIHLGWINNLTGEDVKATYGDGHTEQYTTTNPLPLLDANDQNHDAGTGGDTAFLSESRDTVRVKDDSGFGDDATVIAKDAPAAQFDAAFATGSLITAVGGMWGEFRAYLSAYSGDYDQWYGAYLRVNWSCNFQFSLQDGTWEHDDSQTVVSEVGGLADPTSFSDLGAKSAGPAATSSMKLVTG